ncbi:MAG: TOMM precursor leader peptide-binding protein [Actinophytocola sp.]|uniref:TOMM precursor leader peptide-binding protein n=1 Tax=Actinophytocola sp. TaxID=1872138 RepID=UPI00132B0412|nr:TOMM precursor leader peptide-binding protein [Actinophytocola sp.]MPZ81568.1 TOMM precursor leader peptide-binding protein [Actinophytocola sp.]
MQYGVAAEIEDDEDGTLERILVLLDGTRDADAVCAELPDLDPGGVREAIAELAANGFLEDAAAPLPISEREAARYASPRHYFAWIDDQPRESPYEIQARLKKSSVAVLGLGGTGSAVAAGLVASGVGTVHCVDFDVVEEENLCRQLLYTESDVGLSKVKRAVERLREMNSLVRVTGEELRATCADDIADLMAGRDVFVLCADEPQPDISRWTNEAALRTGTPWFMALYTGPMAVVGHFRPGETGCWECLHRKASAQEHVAHGRRLFPGAPPNAVTAASANVTGHMCALEVVYHLGGLRTQVPGQAMHWNFAHWDHLYLKDVPDDPDCPSCGNG